MHHLVPLHPHLSFFFGADFGGVSKNLGGLAKTAGGVLTIAVGGFRALGHYAAHRMGALVGTVLVAALVGMFFFDPSGTTGVLTGTAKTLLH